MFRLFIRTSETHDGTKGGKNNVIIEVCRGFGFIYNRGMYTDFPSCDVPPFLLNLRLHVLCNVYVQDAISSFIRTHYKL